MKTAPEATAPDFKGVPNAVLARGAGVLIDADAAMERANLHALRARQLLAAGSCPALRPDSKPWPKLPG